MIAVLSLNTAVDRLLLVSDFLAGEVYRAERAEAFAGGKGVNVARVLRQVGESVRLIGTLGGTAAPFIGARCEELGIDARWVPIAGETRTCTIIVDPRSEHQTVLNEPGPILTPEEVERVREEVVRSVSAGDMLCISGSAPPGVPHDFYGELVRALRARGVRVLVDASGDALRSAWESRAWAVAPNETESARALGMERDAPEMVRRLAEQVDHVLLTRGARGLLYAHGGRVWQVAPPPIVAVNAVGSGDALAAGFLAGISRGLPGPEAVRLGVACGASNAARFEPGIGTADEIERLLGEIQVISTLSPTPPRRGSGP
jgi:tagatose 6-phosphate kinase